MTKRSFTTFGLSFICLLTVMLFFPQGNAASTYYSNSFDSASSLNDGYWLLHAASIQTIDNKNTLKVDGEATFMPQQGDFALDNFTVQFDVWHNVHYENNTAYSGPFYEATDSNNNCVIRVGYVQRGSDNNLQQMGFVNFCSGPNGESNHYYFPFSHASEWSTWRLTAIIIKTEGPYYANVTVQINDETVTTFVNDREQTLTSLPSEQIINPVVYHNLLPLPMAGVVLPTYAPTSVSYTTSGIHYELLNTHVKPVSTTAATASYIDNFAYGYANTVPISITPTPTPTPTATPTPTTTPTTTQTSPTTTQTANPTNNDVPEFPQTGPFATILTVALILSIVGIVATTALCIKKNTQKRTYA